MKKLVIILAASLLSFLAESQDAYIMKLPKGIDPIIDGTIEHFWDTIQPYQINKNFNKDSATLTAYWKAVWNDSALFVLISVNDDYHYIDNYGRGDSYSDAVIIFLDINTIPKDGFGSNNGQGHYEFNMHYRDTTGFDHIYWNLYNYAYKFNGPNYVVEFVINWNLLYKKDSTPFDPNKSTQIGFDINVNDMDSSIDYPRVKVWMNNAASWLNEDNENMDSSGVVALVTANPKLMITSPQGIIYNGEVYNLGHSHPEVTYQVPFVLKNLGKNDLNISSTMVTGEGFLIIRDVKKSLKFQESDTLNIQFSSLQIDTFSGALQIISNDVDTSIFTIRLNVFGQNMNVSNSNDDGAGSFRQAVMNAEPGDSITFKNQGDTIYLYNEVVIDKNLTIIGNPFTVFQGSRMLFSPPQGSTDSIVVFLANLGVRFSEGWEIAKNSKVNITNFSFENSSAIQNSGTLKIINSTFINNKAKDYYNGGNGGAISNEGILKLVNCTFYGNSSGNGSTGSDGSSGSTDCYYSDCQNGSDGGNGGNAGNGGAIYNTGNCKIINCTIYSNSLGSRGAGGSGGSGGYCSGQWSYDEYGPIWISGCHGSDGSSGSPGANGSGSAIYSTNSITIKNSIIANNTIYGTVNSGDYNIYYNADETTTGQTSHNITGIDPLLSAPANNGGFIKTCSLPKNSIAVDAITQKNEAPNYDGRGFTRLGIPDIGAFEYGGQILPLKPIRPNGLTSICQNAIDSTLYSTSGASGAFYYVWSLTPSIAGHINGIDTTSTVQWSKTYIGTAKIAVFGLNSNGNGQTSDSLTIKVNTIPTATEAINGDTFVCQGVSNKRFTILPVIGAASYIWNLPTGSTGAGNSDTIVVSFGNDASSGRITVKAHNECGDGPESSLAIRVNRVPAAAGAIKGKVSICLDNNEEIYSVPEIADATSYIWTLPTGATGTSSTDSISVDFGISAVSVDIKVKGQNLCGIGTESILAVSVKNKPPKPIITITGNVLHSNASTGDQWYNQQGLINDSTNQDYYAKMNGNYFDIVTLFGCKSDTSNIINVVLSGVELHLNNNTFKVYPNPVSDELIIEVDGNMDKLRFEILNSTGQVISNGILSEKTVLHTNDFVPGIYLLRLENGKSFIFKEIVKE